MHRNYASRQQWSEAWESLRYLPDTQFQSFAILTGVVSSTSLTLCSLRTLLCVIFTEVTEKGFNILFLLLLLFSFVFLVVCSISGDCYYCISKSPFLYAKLTKFLWLLSLVMCFLHLCSLLLLPVTLQLFKILFIWTLFIWFNDLLPRQAALPFTTQVCSLGLKRLIFIDNVFGKVMKQEFKLRE